MAVGGAGLGGDRQPEGIFQRAFAGRQNIFVENVAGDGRVPQEDEEFIDEIGGMVEDFRVGKPAGIARSTKSGRSRVLLRGRLAIVSYIIR